MVCPKCKSKKVQPITDDKKRFYCVDCNYSWKFENENKEPKGNLIFNGIPTAKQLFMALTKGQVFTPELRAALESQITALLLDQWFEGFKAGQMASILYAKEYYGKNRNEPTRTTCLCKQGISGTQRVGQDRRIRRAQDTAHPRAAEVNPTITEGIHGAKLSYPRGLRVTEDVYTKVANLCEKNPNMAKQFHWDGHKLTAEIT